ncbi:hypothetical protein C9J22_13285 [Photobacterium phosphoreum]|uniref:hypothetical protein n=1 Tax=Photobacterium phosphoreum TaxID=659 RepID=UPI000D1621AA|nr:hypothetical protein [Photobacterium phosphoreum]PSU69846.1 hypothetical protein C9J22_13285 [Photobacterium phosphoreum]
MAICAYCKNDEKLTREHVIPSFMYKFQKSQIGTYIGWNEKAGKMLPSEIIIKDVCGECNNVKLGELDSYAQEFFMSNGIMVDNFVKPNIVLSYNFHHLLRWLLKISYNSSRSSGSHPELFDKYISYILDNDLSQCNQDCFLMVGLVKPRIIDKSKIQEFRENNRAVSSNGEINPFHVRISVVVHDDNSFVMRLVVIGALMFFIPLFKQEMNIGFKKSKIKLFQKINKNVVLIDDKKNMQTLKLMDIDFIDAYAAQVTRIRNK